MNVKRMERQNTVIRERTMDMGDMVEAPIMVKV
jgi:hypothetical protein